ncbi:MAG: ammonia-forming cytochrome c nitrite reductase subunit c552 [Rhodobiaceae bacterium]|nr:ammonia-forming cytochrome c nitrite reductase subunit c552 [Rhodobiaceae bacterium]
MYVGGKRDLLLIGGTTSAHHQIELACETCHTSGLFADARKIEKDMNKACLSCHEDELKVSNDSHPVKKFRDPRNADRREQLDALMCVTCHLEHRPEVTNAMAVTLPNDYCLACHQDVYKERPTHVGSGFETCASAGCHNYHDNTALYEDFLVKHAGGEAIAAHPVQSLAATRGRDPLRIALADADPVATLTAFLRDVADEDKKDTAGVDAVARLARVLDAGDAIAPAAFMSEEAIANWAGSAHAVAGVNCAGCHAPEQAKEGDISAIEANWVESPGMDACQSCHKQEAATFVEGKHGMRAHPELSGPRKEPQNAMLKIAALIFHDEPLPPMPVSEALIPMKPDAAHLTVGSCNACHKPHEQDLKVAAVEACASCHDDAHTKAYFTSPHFRLWEAELAGAGEPGSGVTCADCHMPKIEARGKAFTMHNQNAYFRPNEKMIRPVCSNCHSLEFSIDALADPELVESNFNGRPSLHIPSIDWALSRTRRAE